MSIYKRKQHVRCGICVSWEGGYEFVVLKQTNFSEKYSKERKQYAVLNRLIRTARFWFVYKADIISVLYRICQIFHVLSASKLDLHSNTDHLPIFCFNFIRIPISKNFKKFLSEKDVRLKCLHDRSGTAKQTFLFVQKS